MLLQLMVYAKIIYLLMVVISGALCTVEDYVIMSQCAHNKAIYLAAEGTVSVTDISQIQNITIVGRPDFVNNNFKIALYAKETQRYLCFNDRWKLVGMKELQDTCYFNEAIVHGYFVFRSVVDLQRRIGFTQRGRAVGPKKTVNDACYMFTKIPTDQFFHQHFHFSTPKIKTTTTKIPKIEYTHTPHSSIPGRGGSGSGNGVGGVRTKPNNRFKNHNHNGSGSGSGNGNGSSDVVGGGSGNGSKKFKKQRNGNKIRQQKQEMQQQFRGHNYNLSNPKNSTYLNSSRQNLVLSQNSLNNNSNTNKKQNINNNNNNTNINNSKHPPQNHQVRHHHNDPNKVARRQQHDQKQKTKQRLLQGPTTTSTSILTLSATSAAADTRTIINSTKPHYTLTTSQSQISPTSMTATFSTASSANRNAASSTIMVTKRKGRRRKGEKMHKKAALAMKQMHEFSHDNSKEPHDKIHTYTSSVGTTYEEENEYSPSSTDYAWMSSSNIMPSSAKPTSANLPSWETWYPSSTTIFNDDNSDYTSSDSATVSSPIENYGINRFSATQQSFSTMTDVENNTLTLQTSVPLPTSSVLTTTFTDNSIDETILPSSVTTDLGIATTTTTTTNTSTYTQTDFWSTSLMDNIGLHTEMTNQLNSNYVTPKLEDDHTYGLNTQSYLEENKKQQTDTLTVTLTSRNNQDESEETTINENENITRNSKATEAKTTTSTTTASITTDLNNCAYRTAATYYGSITNNMTTDCIYATEPIANYQKSNPKKNENFFRKNYLNTVSTKSTTKLTTNWPETTPSQSSSTSLTSTLKSASASASQTQAENNFQHNIANDIATTAITLSPIKSTVLTPTTTRRTLRKSTQRLLATPFHQLTYVRNEAGDIDIDSIDNISIYPEIFDNDNNNEPLTKSSTSRLTMISGYLPTSATATLPESIRIAKIKINRERKRMMRLRNVGNYA